MTHADVTEQAPTKLGRKRDHSRDAEILDAALEVLEETGYEGMTIDLVAARAKAGKATLYRRWASKGELVIDAIACMKNDQLAKTPLPDTGTLRGDLLALIKPHAIQDGERHIKVMTGLMSMLSRDPELADVATAAIIEPRAAINRKLFQRAIDRGEIPASTDVAMLSSLSQAMAFHRTLVLRKPVDRAFLISVLDTVIMPAVGLSTVAPEPAAVG